MLLERAHALDEVQAFEREKALLEICRLMEFHQIQIEDIETCLRIRSTLAS